MTDVVRVVDEGLALCLGYAVFFGNVVLMPLWQQEKLGYTAAWVALLLVPLRWFARRPAGGMVAAAAE